MEIKAFWDAVLRQDADAIREYFHPDAWVNWNNTNEHFTVEEFIRANCEYPGEWDGEVEQIITTDTHIITATHVFSKDGSMSYHATSFIRMVDGKIASVDEYWGDDGPAPQWRQNKHIGTKIRTSNMDIMKGIHATNDYERSLFGTVKEQFNDNLFRWYSEVRPDHYNSNFFTPISDLTRQDVLAAVAFQKQRGINEVMFSTTRPVDPSIMDGFDCVEYSAYVMALLSDRSYLWQINEGVEIRDIQTHDITADILDVSYVPEHHREAAYRNMKMVLEVAKTHPEYHWFCAYKDGKRVGTAYAVEHNGFVEMDDLWVEEEYRHQRIGTTIVKHIADHTDGIVYLHATANATPKDMYAKMGFEIVETVYEYYLEW